LIKEKNPSLIDLSKDWFSNKEIEEFKNMPSEDRDSETSSE